MIQLIAVKTSRKTLIYSIPSINQAFHLSQPSLSSSSSSSSSLFYILGSQPFILHKYTQLHWLPIIRRLQAENNKKAGYIICSFQLVSINMSVQWSEQHIVRQMIWPVIKNTIGEERHGLNSLSLSTYSYRRIANNYNFKSSTAVIADRWWLLNIITSFSIEWWWWRHRE